MPPNESHVQAVATIAGGTGRFANASGTLVIEYVQFIDFDNHEAAGAGTVDGFIDLKD